MNLPLPSHAEGAIIYQAFEDLEDFEDAIVSLRNREPSAPEDG